MTASSSAAQWACASRRSAWAPGRARPRERPSGALPRWAGPRRTRCCNTTPHRPSRTRGRARHGKSRRTQRKGGAQLRPRVSRLTATLRAIICHGRLQIGESSIDAADGCIAHVLKRLRGQSSPAPAEASRFIASMVPCLRLARSREAVADLDGVHAAPAPTSRRADVNIQPMITVRDVETSSRWRGSEGDDGPSALRRAGSRRN